MTSAPPTRDRLVDAAAELVDALGPDGVTMRSVGTRAGVSAMAAYRHYPDRDTLLAAVADTGFADLARRLEARAERSLGAHLDDMLDALLDLALDRPHLFALMFTAPRAGARELPREAVDSPTLRVVLAALERGVRDGEFVPHDGSEVALTLAALVQGLCQARYAGRIGLSDQEFRALCHRSVGRVLDGIRA